MLFSGSPCRVSEEKQLITVLTMRSPPSASEQSRACEGDRTRHANGQGRRGKTVDNCFDNAIAAKQGAREGLDARQCATMRPARREAATVCVANESLADARRGSRTRATDKKKKHITFTGAPPGTRTLDPLIKSQLLYQLS